MSLSRLTAVGTVAVCAMLLAQDPKFAVDVNVVNVLATVRDKDGKIVNNLTKDDFVVEEDGKPQEIRYFDHQSDLPLTIGLLVDTSMSQRRLLEDERDASYQFLEQVLRPEKDQAFVIRFDSEVELLQDLTGSRKLLEDALKLLHVPDGGRGRVFGGGGRGRGPMGGRGRGGRRGPRGGGGGIGTALYDAVFLASDEVLKNQPGRKAMILISDGVDAGSKESLSTAIEYAQRSDAIVYSIRYVDEEVYAGRMDRNGEKALTRVSEETGGRMFAVSKKLKLKQIYEQINQEIRNQYSIGYTPAESSGSGYRKVQLYAKDKKLKVQARTGYYPKTP